MTRNLRLFGILAISLFTLASADDDNISQPCRVQSVGDQHRCAVPGGYKVRSGNCSGNDDWYPVDVGVKGCADQCSTFFDCEAFVSYSNQGCFPKTKTCGTPDKSNPLNSIYDKVPSGYTMRPGDCPGNDIWGLYKDDVTRQECAQICDSSSTCIGFMHHDSRGCYPKTKGCGITSLANSLNIFYDKVPEGYSLRPGDCPGNDILEIRGIVSLSECANRCNSDGYCISFMYSDGKECFPKTRTCAQPSTNYPRDVFYDKVPRGYAMRPGACHGNDLDIVFIPESVPMYLELCAMICTDHPECVGFTFFDGHGCFPKSKTCQVTDKGNPKDFFYDKIVIL
ncbi:uncharacterized protein LOC144666838 [Oculina patagonica]